MTLGLVIIIIDVREYDDTEGSKGSSHCNRYRAGITFPTTDDIVTALKIPSTLELAREALVLVSLEGRVFLRELVPSPNYLEI